MKLLFLGLFFCEESLKCAFENSKCGVQMAPHLFQTRLIKGLKSIDDLKLNILNVPPMGTYPKNHKRIFSKKYTYESGTQVGYLNLPILKNVILKHKLFSLIKESIATNGITNILMYTPYEPFLFAIKKIKKIYPSIKVTLIQTDAIPGYGMIQTRRMKKIGDKIIKELEYIDNFVLLSKFFKEILKVKERPYVITECIGDSVQERNFSKEKSDNIFLYSGTTASEYGIKDVVDAFKEIKNAQLWICGSGDSDDYIKHTALTHPNIKHFGYVNQEELNELRNQCDFLINPRRPSGDYTKYSFPSKTAEYMLSGKPLIMYKLEAIPDEYDEFITYLNGTRAKAIKEEIEKILEMDYTLFNIKASNARDFMLNNKNCFVQANKIIDMLKNR